MHVGKNDFVVERNCKYFFKLIIATLNFTQIKYNIVQVRIEAARCLGELGPSDLMTIILQSKDIPVDTAGAPLSFTTNCVVKLLLKYLLCSNMKLVRAASEALYNVMNTKEGKALKGNCNKSF